MSYDLAFWQQSDRYVGDAAATCRRLVEDGDSVEGLERIPVDQILDAVQARFPNAVREPNGDEEWISYVGDDGTSFQITWSPQHLYVNCRGSSHDDMNALIDIAHSHGCPLYDPQVDERFA